MSFAIKILIVTSTVLLVALIIRFYIVHVKVCFSLPHQTI